MSVDAPDKVSPEMQAEAIEAQCKLKGWELVDLIVERGRSAGEGKKRPGLDRARKLIRTGKARGLVVWKIDRCSRSVRDFAEILAELRDHDADFVSVTESFDTSNAMGRAMLQITMVFAELERARMGERAAAWQAYRAKQGGTPTTRAILGYRRVDGQLLLDEQTAPIVKQAVEILLETGSLSAAAGFLRDCGHPKYLSAARSLLSSPTLAGGRCVDGVFVPGGWPALIDVETHEAVLAIFADPRRVNKGRPASQRWLLTSIAMCGAPGCGLPMGAGQATPAAMYRCARVRRPFMAGPPCGLQIVRDGLDAYVEQRLLARVTPDMWQRMRTRRRTVAAPVVDGVALEAKLSQLAEDWGRDRITRARVGCGTRGAARPDRRHRGGRRTTTRSTCPMSPTCTRRGPHCRSSTSGSSSQRSSSASSWRPAEGDDARMASPRSTSGSRSTGDDRCRYIRWRWQRRADLVSGLL